MKPLLSQLSIASVGHGVEKVISLVVITFLAHHLDKALLGQFFFAIGVCSVVALVNEFGTSRYLVRAIAQDREAAAAHLGAVLRLRLPLLALSFAAINGTVALAAPYLVWTFVFISIFVLLENLYFAFGSALVGLGAVSARIATGLTGPLLLLALVPLATLLDLAFEHIVVIYAAAALAMSVVGFLEVHRRIGRLPRSQSIAFKGILQQCSLLFAVNVALVLHARVDEWMLAALRDFREVASYAAAYKVAEVSRTAIRPITMVLVPLFAAAAVQGAAHEMRMYARRAFWLTGAIAVVVAGVVIAVADVVVPLLFGDAYAETVTIMRILFLGVPALFVGHIAMLIGSALRLDRQVLALAACAVILNVVFNLFAIPAWGAIGAAWTTLATESLLAVALVIHLAARLQPRAPDCASAAAPHA